MKVLLINSDLAKNRGDRAIAEGIIELIKKELPGAEITAISEHAKRDRDWFGIDFLPIDAQSLKVRDMKSLLTEAGQSDIILWGGGELLKDYTNRLALWYWALKIKLIARANPNIYGVFQGIGPTASPRSRKLITKTVSRCRMFIVRDNESYEKLIQWGVKKDKLISSSDPAVFPTSNSPSEALQKKLIGDFNFNTGFTDNFVCIGPRSWFHYKPGGLLPHRYKKYLQSLLPGNLISPNLEFEAYRSNLVNMVDRLVEVHNVNVLLIPMHMTEDDRVLCDYIKSTCKRPSAVRTLNKDSLSPAEIRSVLSMAKAMVGFRLHSNILAISSNIPSINVYYVDKGRVFFESIKMRRYAVPIERVLSDSFIKDFDAMFDELMSKRSSIGKEIKRQTDQLRKSVDLAFSRILKDFMS